MVIKETLLREAVKTGLLGKDEVTKFFKVDRNKVEGVFDFLVEKQDIVAKEQK